MSDQRRSGPRVGCHRLTELSTPSLSAAARGACDSSRSTPPKWPPPSSVHDAVIVAVATPLDPSADEVDHRGARRI